MNGIRKWSASGAGWSYGKGKVTGGYEKTFSNACSLWTKGSLFVCNILWCKLVPNIAIISLYITREQLNFYLHSKQAAKKGSSDIACLHAFSHTKSLSELQPSAVFDYSFHAQSQAQVKFHWSRLISRIKSAERHRKESKWPHCSRRT